MKGIILLIALLAVSGCASSNIIPLTQNTALVSTSAAPACGKQGAQKVALAVAAAATLRAGYDRFIIVGIQGANNVRVVGTTPVYSNTTITGSQFGNVISGAASTTYSGGTPIIGGSHDQDFSIQMYRTGDAGSENALDARFVLGPDWPNEMKKPQRTCF